MKESHKTIRRSFLWPVPLFSSRCAVAILFGWTALVVAACTGKVIPSSGIVATPGADLSKPSGGPGLPARNSEASKPASALEASKGSTLATAATPTGQTSTGSDTAIPSRGAELFTKYCVICHGEKGDGAGKFAYLMNPRPRDFKKGNFKLSTTQNQIPTDEDLVRTISRGMPGSAMPSWGHLPLADLQALAKYVRHFNVEGTREQLQAWVDEGKMKRADLPQALADRTVPGRPLIIPPETPFDEIHWFHGRQLYLENCASCHGVDGQPVAEAVKFDAEGYPVPPRSFVNGIFKGGSDGHQLYARIWKGMKGTPMPASEGNYSDDQMWDIIHYVQSLARPGAQQRAQLRQGTFVAPTVRGELPASPSDSTWSQARPLYVALTPLWWAQRRIEGLVVQALHNDQELAIRLSWIDPTLDDRAVRQNEFRDGVAIQFSLSSDPPFYMGDNSKHGGVNIWFWKADRQHDIDKGYQDVDAPFANRAVDSYPEQESPPAGTPPASWFKAALTTHDPQFITAWGAGNLVADPNLKTSVESLVAHGPGTLSGKPANIQMVQGKAVYERGVWSVQLQRRMTFTEGGHEGERGFRQGDYLPVSFAIWNGSSGDRDGKKNISIWQKLLIE